MYTKIRFIPALLAAMLAFGVAHAADNKPVAVVNGVAIPQEDMDFILKQAAEHGNPDSPALREKIRESLVKEEVVVQEAKKQGLDKSPDYLRELKMQERSALINAFLVSYVKAHPVTEDDLKAEYAKQVAPMAADKEYHARHILVATEKEANDVLAQLKKGKAFDALAKQKSTDPSNKDNGGDLGWQKPGAFVPEFSDAMVKLAKGQISPAPVKTKFGYHIIKLEDVRPVKAPDLEQVKGQLEQYIQHQRVDALVKELSDKAKVE